MNIEFLRGFLWTTAILALMSTVSSYIHANAAVFGEDGRQAISDLRKKDPALLSDEEKAILQASLRVGTLSCPNGEGYTNATLIKLPNGRDAVVSSAHSLFDAKNKPICDLTTTIFFYNLSYALNDGSMPSDHVRSRVSVEPEMPFNFENVAISTSHKTDFLIFPLSKDISDDITLDGTVRGYMKFDAFEGEASEYYLIGRNVNFQQGKTIAYDRCTGKHDRNALFHLCATTCTSSSSSLSRLIDGELYLSGIHRGQFPGDDGTRAITNYIYYWNRAVPIEHIIKYLDGRYPN